MLGALAGTGPAVLYNRLNGLTFNPPGYTIVMYQSCMQNQNAGNPCGSFSTFESANGVYTTQLYGPEAPVSSSCSRTFRLAVACGATMSMSGVNENPTCVYSATLTLPEACGIDMTVGNEAASASGTVAPPTPSITRTSSAVSTSSGTLTNTPTFTVTSSSTITSSITSTWSVSPVATLTSSPLFAMTAYPSPTTTPSVAVTTTPLFMVTGFPTPSPVNVSAAAGGDSAAPASSSTATILGAVAVGVLGIVLIAGAIIYFRNGGTLGGLVNKIKENKETIQKIAGNVTSALPISDEQKKAITGALADPLSVLPAEAQKAAAQAVAAAGQVAAVAGKAQELKSQAIDALPISDEQKAMLTAAIDAKLAEAMKRIESTPVGVHVKSLVEVAPAVPEPPEPPAAAPPEPPAAEPTLVTDNISTEELASLREFMASKQANKD